MSRKITDGELALRKDQIVHAAAEVFLRYGYARTTMADLAMSARISRPTLYELFPGKEELFSAVASYLSRVTLQEYRQTLPRLRSLKTKLHRFCTDWATHGLRLSQLHPDAKDLFNLEFAAVRGMYDDFIGFLIEVISAEPHTSKLPLEKVVYNLVFSFPGLLEAARNVEHMEELVALQVDIFLATIAPTP